MHIGAIGQSLLRLVFNIMKTLFILVTCTKDITRNVVLEKVVENLSNVLSPEMKENLLVFDNNSTFPGSVDLLTKNFTNVFQSKSNIGYWSAINWCLDNYAKIFMKEYEFAYIIESDLIHSENTSAALQDCELFLSTYPEIGMIRTEEFSIEERHLYDKDRRYPETKTYAWVRQFNRIEGIRVEFMQTNFNSIFVCNFLAKLPALSRIKSLKDVFQRLKLFKKFSEIEYQNEYYSLHQLNAVYNGGIFHSKLSNENIHSVINGSFNHNAEIDYRPTRDDTITETNFEDVLKLS
jgi:hypothetical protein